MYGSQRWDNPKPAKHWAMRMGLCTRLWYGPCPISKFTQTHAIPQLRFAAPQIFARKWEKIRWKKMGIAAALGLLSPFPFYFWLWTYPQTWVDLCGKGRDPCTVMAYVSHFLKLIQFLSLFSVSTFTWPPLLYFWPLIAFGQFLNFRSVQLYSFTHIQVFLIVVWLKAHYIMFILPLTRFWDMGSFRFNLDVLMWKDWRGVVCSLTHVLLIYGFID